nr:hypothetical protein CFP56_48177 [Quercus suber]
MDLMWQVLMVDGVEVAKAVRVATIAWALWHNSNELRNGGEKKSGKAPVQRAMDYLTEYEAAVEVEVTETPDGEMQ